MKLKKKIRDQDHSNNYITTQEDNKLTAHNFAARLAQANLARKNGIAGLVKKIDFDDKLKNLKNKVSSNKGNHVHVENEFKKMTEISFKPFYWSKLIF